jgi:hypothetical protein
MGMVINPFWATVAAKVLTFQTHAEDTSNATTYTFAGKAIGTAAADRRVHVAVAGTQGTRTVSSVKVHVPDVATDPTGTTLTQNVSRQDGVTTVALYVGVIASGTTADIVVTWSAGQDRCGIGIWSSTGLTSNSAVDTKAGLATDGAGLNLTPTTVAGGFLIGVVCDHSSGSGLSTWTTATERYDVVLEGATPVHSGADYATPGSSVTININTATNGNGNASAAMASF